MMQQRETSPELEVTCPHITLFLLLSDVIFDLFPSEFSGDKIGTNEMGGACSADG
jgi:hypothetical protein